MHTNVWKEPAACIFYSQHGGNRVLQNVGEVDAVQYFQLNSTEFMFKLYKEVSSRIFLKNEPGM
jgi:hypothetical protein